MISSASATAKKTGAYGMVGMGAVLHFLMDGVCACCLTLLAGTADAVRLLGVFIAYNVLAFLTQPLTGMLADRLRHGHRLLLTAAGLLAAGALWTMLTAQHWPTSPACLYGAALLLGSGNSLFHVWGGKLTAVVTANDIRALGVFVSTGVVGLTVGMGFASWGLLLVLTGLFVAIACLFPTLPAAFSTRSSTPAADAPPLLSARPWLLWLCVMGLMAFVMLRSLVGEVFTSALRGSVAVLAVAVVAMLGKAAGGWMGKGMGVAWALLLMLAVASACLLWQGGAPWQLLGLFMINCTMPVTLYLANTLLRGREGLAFGLLAAALMPGYLLAQSADHALSVVPGLLLTLVPTIIIEYGVLVALREHRADVRWSSVAVNILTNIPLNLFVTYVSSSLAAIIAGEVLVVVVEALWYLYFVGDVRRALAYSFLCNAFSCLIGLLISLLLSLSAII